MQEITVGPFALATRQIIPIAAIVIAALVIRYFGPASRDARRRALDVISNGALLFFVVWKLTPLLTETAAVMRDPRVLLVAPGGRLGMALGLVALAVYLFFLWRRSGRPELSADAVRQSPVAVLVVLTGVTALLLGLGLHGADLALAQAGAGDGAAAEFELETLDGDRVSLSQYRGKVVVVNFWATWCVPCRAETEVKNRIAAEYDSDDVVVLGVNLTSGESGKDAVEAYANEWGIEYPVLLDTRGEVASAYNVRGTPTTVVIDREGQLSDRYFGALSLSAARRLVDTASDSTS